MNSQLFLAFIVVAAALACTPGVDWAYSITAGLKQRSFVPAVAGLCSGYVLHTALLVLGLAALLAGMPGVLGWLTIAGAGYLLWLGVGTLRSWRGASFSTAAAGGQGASIQGAGVQGAGTNNQLRTFLQGMGTSGINPKGLLFYVALVPQFVSTDAAFPVPVQSGLLGLTFVALAGLVYTGVALLARTLLQSRPGAARIVTLASGIIMVALGVVLLSEQLLPLVLR
ncbi:LysE family translocator [Pseudarthrobacter sp. J75]|uniref:LysE family translocator n=1 Tax=unclassified Pseudarthrobacter TaxID=2647000 RepID=UPI002E8222DB|nr:MULTISPECIES: LysE family translocator [unclassified Pseudarthrobacter]MEE2523703.1 LysE family translocator [Pseudarthrobacter sp. J47]MEE2530094.1 LysE family translocator [Pseudarthrobacter sp. J75]